MYLHLERGTRWYVENLTTAPANLGDLNEALTNKFKVDKENKNEDIQHEKDGH